jgi:hypothetical protein
MFNSWYLPSFQPFTCATAPVTRPSAGPQGILGGFTARGAHGGTSLLLGLPREVPGEGKPRIEWAHLQLKAPKLLILQP